MVSRWRARLERLWQLGVLETDSDDERIAKEAANLGALVITLLSCVWVGTYAALGLWLSAAIPLAYQVMSILGLVLLVPRGRAAAFRRSQLGAMLVLPFLLQWSLGGFAASGAVALWAVVTPFGALVFYGARGAVPWLAAFLALLAVSAALDGRLPGDATLPSWLVVTFFFLNGVGLSLSAFLLLQYFVRARDRAHALLHAERERSERLLLNILPAPVAERLKQGAGVIAERHPDVSVLFADLAGFTPAVELLTPEEVVTLLDEVFSAFDELVASLGLEKIKTIGDGYLVAGGIPEPLPDHAGRIAELALALREALAAGANGHSLALRVGIDTGPVVAGVIGRSKFGYDLWGDTVNTASRMQSHAPTGAIQVTERTYRRLAGRYSFERRGSVEVKGKGSMTTYVLLGRHAGTVEQLRSDEELVAPLYEDWKPDRPA